MALVSIFALRSDWRFAVPVVWVANTFGFVDFLIGMRAVVSFDVPSFNLDTKTEPQTPNAKICIMAPEGRI